MPLPDRVLRNITRRAFLGTAAASLASCGRRETPAEPKRIAVITTIYRYLSHAQHIADRFLVGYP